MSNITLPLFVLVTIRDSWFIEEQNSFLAHVNPLGPTHVSFYYGFRWHRESEQCHIKKVIIFLLWLTSVRKLTFCFAEASWVRAMPYQKSHYFSSVAHFSKKTDLLFCWQKTTVRQPDLCMPPVKRFCLLMSSCEKATLWENISTLLNNWKCSFATILHKRLLLHAKADSKLLAIFCI